MTLWQRLDRLEAFLRGIPAWGTVAINGAVKWLKGTLT